ncbi:uncharacterized protein LOC128554912 [Mercenaria mercenaria]|uniref:uncharacterized protein LOC128554912 n=1 Tax=Mercenaria mercenaria TaxID=6596 RepID=UPI00234F1BB0|nr:uncharacterized protein LOC128554912 [Mercenaria mercenaria]
MYGDVIDEQLKKGIIEEVDKRITRAGLIHYIPHHAVVTPTKSTTKLRIVYDASARAKQSDRSLNENLYRGPVMLHDLCGMLMRFRLHKIALVADIEKAFLQIGLQPIDRDVTRFLWIKDFNKPVTEKDNITEYRFCRVPFGVISSPFLLGATVEYHLESFGTQIAEKIKNDIYVDNLVTGTETISEAINMYQEGKSMFDEISMNLPEWITNDEQFNAFIQNKDRANHRVMKVLGHNWDTETDELSIKSSVMVQDTEMKETKRSVLKTVASIFDPLGSYSPTILQAKAYSCCVYLHQENSCGTKAELIFAKARLAPVKKLTIPKLELMAVLIGVRCLQFVIKQLRLDLDQYFLWTDSQCVLHWIRSKKDIGIHQKQSNRNQHTHKDITFGYVTTSENPAGVASRGVNIDTLQNSDIWWHGPKWLSLVKSEWPHSDCGE